MKAKIPTKQIKQEKITLRSLSEKMDKTFEEFAILMAKGFAGVDARFTVLENRLDTFERETADNFAQVRQAILEQGDKFVSRYEFDRAVARISVLEDNSNTD